MKRREFDTVNKAPEKYCQKVASLLLANLMWRKKY